MRTKISKVAKDLNVGVNTAVEFLRKNNIEVDAGPNARIDDDAVELLTREFSKDKDAKAVAERFIKQRHDEKKEKNPRVSEDRGTTLRGPKILGTIDLSNPGAGMEAATDAAAVKKGAEGTRGRARASGAETGT